MPTIDVLDSTIFYEDAGAGTPFVFLHGNPTSSHLWRHVLPRIGEPARLLAPDAAQTLAGEGIDAAVVNVATLKPLDVATITAVAASTGRVVTAENHSIVGGLGSAVAETLMEAGVRCRFARVGIRDTFAEGASAPHLFEQYGLTSAAIADACRTLRERRVHG